MFPLLTLLTASSSVEPSGDQHAVVLAAPHQHEHHIDNSAWAGWWCPDCA